MQGYKYSFKAIFLPLCWMSILLLGFAQGVHAAEEITTQLLEKINWYPAQNLWYETISLQK